MSQVNFRVSKDEKDILEILAHHDGLSIAEFTRRMVLSNIQGLRVELAFDLLKNKKIGRKRAWILSGLGFHEFMLE